MYTKDIPLMTSETHLHVYRFSSCIVPVKKEGTSESENLYLLIICNTMEWMESNCHTIGKPKLDCSGQPVFEACV